MKGHIFAASFLVLALNNTYAAVEVVNSKGTCEELKIGSQRVVSIPTMKSSTRIEQYFTLLRTSKEDYELYLNYDFQYKKGWKQDKNAISSANATFKKRIQACFDKESDLLKDETGRKIRLFVYNSQTHAHIAKPSSVEINVLNTTSDKFRANSHNYPADIACPVLLHESLHLTGLVDEYEEEQLKTFFLKRPKYNRRALGPNQSIMRGYWGIDNTNVDHILFSAQINTIVYPSCTTKNSKYYSCAALAYKTGNKAVPEFCLNEDWVKVEAL
jgi:hypothetical protein